MHDANIIGQLLRDAITAWRHYAMLAMPRPLARQALGR